MRVQLIRCFWLRRRRVRHQSASTQSKHAQAREVPWYRVVVEVALHDRLEPLAGLAHGIVHPLAELLLNLSQLHPHAFANRLAPHHESP